MLASFCQWSPGIRANRLPLPWTTSSWLIGQHVVLAERVDERERQLALVVRAVHRVALDVLERVVHPAHVPLEPEAEAGLTRRRGDAGEARRLLGDHRDAGVALVRGRVDLLEEVGSPPGSRARRGRSAPTRRPRGSSRGRAWMRRRRRAVRRRGTPRTSTARSPRGSCAPRCGRSRRCTCPTRGARRAADPECSYSGSPSKRASANASFGKCPGTQSMITPMPAWCSRSIR